MPKDVIKKMAGVKWEKAVLQQYQNRKHDLE